MKRSRFDLGFDIVVYILLGLLLLSVAYPLYFIVIASVSDPIKVTSGQVLFFPTGINFDSYGKVVEYDTLWTGYRNTLIYTACYTFLSVSVTLMAGYALSRKKLVGRGAIMAYMTVTMFFSGGLIPTYLLVQGMDLIGNPLTVIILGSVSVYNIIIARTFMQSNIPDELFEAATIDGCRHFRFFFSFALPLSPALIAVLVLFAAVGQWNSWFNALIYLRKQQLMPLQMVLRDIIVSQGAFMREMAMESQGDDFARQILLVESMKYSVIIVATLPILCLYPFIQRYFVKGIMVGSIKG
jgi:putative aldouronate transport system permease protein